MSTQRNQPNWLFQAIFEVISPIVRLLIGTLNYSQFCEILRLAYVREAKRIIENRNDSTRITKSELSLLTGIDSRQLPSESHLVDTSKKFSLIESFGQTELHLYPESEILGLWQKQTEYLSADFAKKKIIPITGKRNSFEALVRKFYTRGVTIQSVLARLQAYGNVEVIEQDFVRLKNKIYIPMHQDKEELLKVGLIHLHHLADTISNNNMQENDECKFFQRHVRSVGIRQEDFTIIRKSLSKDLLKSLLSCETKIVAVESEQENSGNNYCGVGFYYFEHTDAN